MGRKQEDGPPLAFFTENGKHKIYRTLFSGGVNDDDIVWSGTKQKAVDLFVRSLVDFVGDKKRVVWRRRPEMEVNGRSFAVFARLYVE